MPGSLRLGKIAGIDINAHWSWFIILVLLTWSLASSWFAQLFPGWATTIYWIAAFISALLLFVCVLVHELAHALVAQTSGLTVKNITFFIFGGMASIEEDMQRVICHNVWFLHCFVPKDWPRFCKCNLSLAHFPPTRYAARFSPSNHEEERPGGKHGTDKVWLRVRPFSFPVTVFVTIFGRSLWYTEKG